MNVQLNIFYNEWYKYYYSFRWICASGKLIVDQFGDYNYYISMNLYEPIEF